jgi:hypothetical protein
LTVKEVNQGEKDFMEIIIGSIPPLGPPAPRIPAEIGPGVEAHLLHIRPPRRGIAGPSGMERRGKKVSDPLKGRVLTVLVPNADSLPKDIDTDKYKVILRFIRK